MSRLVAFLRAINVGGRNVTMEALRHLVGELGFSAVETFIASGNVIFENPAALEDPTALGELEEKLAAGLQKGLGYPVETFIRTLPQLSSVTKAKPFPEKQWQAAVACNVAFLREPVPDGALEQFRSEIDVFASRDCEVYWLCRRKQSESKFSGAMFEKKLSLRATFRSLSTVRKIATKYA